MPLFFLYVLNPSIESFIRVLNGYTYQTCTHFREVSKAHRDRSSVVTFWVSACVAYCSASDILSQLIRILTKYYSKPQRTLSTQIDPNLTSSHSLKVFPPECAVISLIKLKATVTSWLELHDSQPSTTRFPWYQSINTPWKQ